MGKLVEGLKIAAYVAEIVMASTVVIELAGKCSGKMKAKRAASGNASITDDKITSYEL